MWFEARQNITVREACREPEEGDPSDQITRHELNWLVTRQRHASAFSQLASSRRRRRHCGVLALGRRRRRPALRHDRAEFGGLAVGRRVIQMPVIIFVWKITNETHEAVSDSE